jgi:hypothetical protein
MKRTVRNCIFLFLGILSPYLLVVAGNPSGTGGLRFTENKGQFIATDGNARPDILYKGQAAGADIYLTRQGVSFVIVTRDVQEQEFHDMEGEAAEKMRMANAKQVLERIDMNLVGISPNFTVKRGEPLSSMDHYYLGHCPDGILNVQSFSDITYEDVFPGIDWHFSVKDGLLKTEFLVSPGADPGQIRFAIAGAQSHQILPNGSLNLIGNTGHVEDAKPEAMQGNQPVTAEYLWDDDELGFSIGNYDHNQPLVIDPYTRVYSTFFGGSGGEWYLGHVTATDASGNVFLGGTTSSTNFPTTAGMFQTTNAGGQDGFIAKFDNNGARLWGTYYGGSSTEGGIAFKVGLCVDNSGNIWYANVTSSTNFPVTAGCFQAANMGGMDVGLVKLTTAGVRLYATYYGGNGSESPSISRWGANSAPALASDASGNIFMTGLTQSTTLPVTAGCFQATNGGGTDAYLVKWSNAGARLYATYYGGSGNEESACVGIAVDNGGNAWMTGCTGSSNFPTTAGAFQTTFAGTFDQYLVKWNNACVRQYATYYGGTGDEGVLCDVDVTATGDVWMGVYVQSTNFPVTAGASQPTNAGGWEFGLVRFSNAGGRLYASYYGSNNQEEPWDISVDRVSGNVCLTGATWGTTLSTMGPPFQSASAGSQEGAIVVMNSSGAPIYCTYYGGAGHDEAFCSVFDINRNLWVSGMAAASSFPTTPGAFQTVNAGSTDPFLAKFQPPVILDQSEVNLQIQSVENQRVNLIWTFLQDELVSEYVLERDMGGRWEPVHQTAPDGSGNYAHADEVPLQGMVQYRVRLEMKDGSTAYSQMVRVEIRVTEDRLLQVWPNPTHSGDEVKLLYQMKEAGALELNVVTLEGRQVLHKRVELAAGRAKLDFSTENWASGVYLLQLNSAHGNTSTKITVE